MHIEQLRYFIEVAKTGHLTHASENLDLSQPALSNSISRLEAELNVSLFERKGRNIVLNAYGEAFLPYAETIVNTLGIARTTLSQMQLSQNKTVKIQTSYMGLYPELLPKLLAVEPELSFINALEPVHILEENLLTGATDFCLTYRSINNHQLKHELIEREKLFVAISRKNELSQKDVLSPQELYDKKFIIHDQYSTACYGLKMIFEGSKKKPSIAFAATNFNEAYEYVAQNIGITLITAFAYKKSSERQQSKIKLISLTQDDGSEFYIDHQLYWRKHTLTEQQKKIKNAIIKFLKKEFASIAV